MKKILAAILLCLLALAAFLACSPQPDVSPEEETVQPSGWRQLDAGYGITAHIPENWKELAIKDKNEPIGSRTAKTLASLTNPQNGAFFSIMLSKSKGMPRAEWNAYTDLLLHSFIGAKNADYDIETTVLDGHWAKSGHIRWVENNIHSSARVYCIPMEQHTVVISFVGPSNSLAWNKTIRQILSDISIQETDEVLFPNDLNTPIEIRTPYGVSFRLNGLWTDITSSVNNGNANINAYTSQGQSTLLISRQTRRSARMQAIADASPYMFERRIRPNFNEEFFRGLTAGIKKPERENLRMIESVAFLDKIDGHKALITYAPVEVEPGPQDRGYIIAATTCDVFIGGRTLSIKLLTHEFSKTKNIIHKNRPGMESLPPRHLQILNGLRIDKKEFILGP